MANPKQYPPPVEQPFLQHLIELRDRLLRVVLVVIVVFLSLFAFANDIYSYLAAPLMRHLPEGASMIATEVASPFLTPFKLTLVLSVFIAVPVILYQLWGFIAPGLYQNERRLIFPLMFSSTLLFFTGMAFAYYVVFPLVFGFLIGMAPEGVSVMTDITKYLDFVLKMFFAFGLAFEVPIATILVVWSGMTTAEELGKKRPYIIVGAFVFGMLLTPPDVISQTLLAVPMWLLFEAGLIMSRWYTKPAEEDEEEESIEPLQDTIVPAAASAGAAAAASSAASSANTVKDHDKDSVSEDDANNSGHGEYEPLTDEQMDAELDRIEAHETAEGSAEDKPAEDVAEDESSAKQATSVGDFREEDGIDEEAHARATEEALAIARAAAGDVSAAVNNTDEDLDETPIVYTEEDHQRITEEAMTIARAAAGIPDETAESENTTTAGNGSQEGQDQDERVGTSESGSAQDPEPDSGKDAAKDADSPKKPD